MLFFWARSEVVFEARSGNADFLAGWWKQNEIPFSPPRSSMFVWVCDELVLKSDEGRTGLHSQFVLRTFILSWTSGGLPSS